jgi:D-glycero-D-manno-heptose 1,7-bisphosphate phosphatase
MLRQAIFLVGGLGTRLKDRTRATPKPLLEIGGRPFLDYLLDEAARYGFDDILLLAGHFGEQVEARYHGKDWHGATIRVLREPEPLGTGGALRFAAPHLAPAFLMANGDSFFDINLRALAVPQMVTPDGVAMALRPAAEGRRYGCVRLENGLVKSFHAPEEGVSGPINAGIYAIGRGVVDRIPQGAVSLEGAIFPLLAREGRMRGLVRHGYFIDIGVPEDFVRADRELAEHARRPAVFLDRDGVLNHDSGYVHKPEEFHWRAGAADAIRLCNERGVFVFVVTNQAGVARGFYDEGAVHALHRWMDEQLAAHGAHIDAYEYCPDHPEGTVAAYAKASSRRKPEPGMLLDLFGKWNCNREKSFLVGDQPSDIAAALAAGIPGYQAEDNLAAQLEARLDALGIP